MSLPAVPTPVYAVFCDFDETFFRHQRDQHSDAGINALSALLKYAALNHQVIFGWVTGSSLETVLKRLRHHSPSFRPHFAATDLGTRIVTFDPASHEAVELTAWTQKLTETTYSHAVVEEIVHDLHSTHRISLRPQPTDHHRQYLRNFYLQAQSQEKDQARISLINDVCAAAGIATNINRCNPAAGDPENTYDVDFIPEGTGKKAVVDFIRDHHQLSTQRTAAFGDSGNDLPMLSTVGHGWLVSNATEEAKAQHIHVTENPHAAGVHEGIRHLLSTHWRESSL